MHLASISRSQWVLLGLLLRIGLLGWGVFQDAHSTVPYTDIDYQVFTSATRHLVSACPLEAIINVPSQEEYDDLIDPPQAKGSCAQGFIPAASRFILQAQPELDQLQITSTAFQSESDDLSDKLTSISFSLLNPIFRFFAGLGNPYKRDTYRYTPLLAVLLTPGEFLDPDWGSAFFGKIVFILADIIVALLIWDIMDLRRTIKDGSRGNDWYAGVFWLVNPFTAQISTRGSSESILGVLVLAFLDATLLSYPEKSRSVPVISNGHLNEKEEDTFVDADSEEVVQDAAIVEGEALAAAEEANESNWNNSALMAPFFLAFAIHWKLYPIIYAAALIPHLINTESIRAVFRFGGITIYSLLGISGPVYAIWGYPYLQETIFYHLSRSDHRHNFSPFFLLSYLTSWPNQSETFTIPLLTSLQPYLAFIPQLGLSAYLGFSIGSQDLVAAMTFQTIAFVAFNKVCTSQYYMWIIWFLPIIAPSLHFSGGIKEVGSLVALWVAAQVSIQKIPKHYYVNADTSSISVVDMAITSIPTRV